jgi:hypothetical protein
MNSNSADDNYRVLYNYWYYIISCVLDGNISTTNDDKRWSILIAYWERKYYCFLLFLSQGCFSNGNILERYHVFYYV